MAGLFGKARPGYCQYHGDAADYQDGCQGNEEYHVLRLRQFRSKQNLYTAWALFRASSLS